MQSKRQVFACGCGVGGSVLCVCGGRGLGQENETPIQPEM